jgi:hypothetical protein
LVFFSQKFLKNTIYPPPPPPQSTPEGGDEFGMCSDIYKFIKRSENKEVDRGWPLSRYEMVYFKHVESHE